jgi:hypothetical protein
MLTDLRTQVTDEGTEEAKTYDKFACFCKSNIEAKTKAISEGKTEKDSLQAKINDDASTRTELEKTIAENVKKVKQIEDHLAQAKSDRKSERLTFEENEVELTRGLQALASAILAMKSAKKGIGFAQLSAVAKSALVMAQSLVPKATVSHNAIAAFISEDAPNDAYSFQGDDIIKTLEDLKSDFGKKKDELVKTETDAKADFDKLIEDKEKALKEANETIETSNKDKAKASGRIATAFEDLSTVSATLLDDQQFLSKLSDKCGEKAVLWDKRVKTRAAELQALSTAINLMESLPKEKAKALIDTSMLAPSPAPVFVQMVAKVHSAVSAAARSAPAGLHQQKQQQKPRQSLAATVVSTQLRSQRARAVAVLREQAEVLKSEMLSELAAHASADPFAKVKKLIQELIERLLKEAAEEASHKGWCDKEYAMTTMKRDNAATDLKELNGLLEVSEARRAKLGEEIKVLKGEIKDLEGTLKKSTELRKTEKSENEASIKEAKEGKEIVEKAIDTLEKFYKTAANEAKSLLQVRSADAEQPDIPDAGFDDEYAGAQDGSVGVLGMLDVIKSDFERTVTDTEAAEKQAQKSFLEQETEIGMSTASKGESLKSSEKAKSEADKEDSSNRDKLKDSQTTLDKSLGEMASLDKACKQGGMTAEERKQQREEEMAALKKALSIIEGQ